VRDGDGGGLVIEGPQARIRERLAAVESELRELRRALAATNALLLELQKKHNSNTRESARLHKLTNDAVANLVTRTNQLEKEILEPILRPKKKEDS
jgi:Mg2+ and Co2+ transporter CorA